MRKGSASLDSDPSWGAEAAPESVIAAAKAAFQRSGRPGTLAQLAFDSDRHLLGVARPRHLRFEHPSASLDVHVASSGSLRYVTAFSNPHAQLSVERYLEPPEAPAPLADGTAFAASEGELLRVATAPTAAPALRSEWFRV